MATRATSLHLLLVVSTLAAACGDSGGGSGDDAAPIDARPADAPPPPQLSDICGGDGVVTRMFARVLACNPAFDLITLQGRLDVDRETAFCNGALAPYLGDGSIKLPTTAQLKACLDYIADTPCLDLNFSFSTGPCDLLGQVADAGMCEINDQCGASSYCVGAQPGGSCGACTPKLIDGMTCTDDAQCLNGACVGTQCGHKGVDGDPCFADNDCLGQRQCNMNTNKCETPPKWQVNDACTNPGRNQCDPIDTGLYCNAPSGGNGQCKPFIALGNACTVAGVSQGVCDLRAYQHCPAGADAVCTAPTLVDTEGMPCGIRSGEKCTADLACTSPLAGGTCVSPQQEGEACTVNGQPTDACDLFLQCFPTGSGNKCQYGDYSGSCP